jgi:GWxTD domain-containing protein
LFQSSLVNKLVLFLIVSIFGFADGKYIDTDLGVTLDQSRFSIEGGVYLEVYLMIPQSQFTYKEATSGLEASVVIQVVLLQDDVVPYPPDRWQRTYKVGSQAAVARMGFVPDISKFSVEAGDYVLQVDILDANSNRRQRIRKPITLELFPEDQLSISDISIASQIVKTQVEGDFTKYGHDIVPNAERIFSPAAPTLFYYFEAYGLSGSDNYSILTQVLSLNGLSEKDMPIRAKKNPGGAVVEWGQVDTKGLKSGIHKLMVTVTDEFTGASVSQKATFYIIKPRESGPSKSVSVDEYASMTGGQLDERFQIVSHVMSRKEIKLFKKSDVTGKRMVLKTFWSRNDPTPETPENEYKDDFFNRVQVVNREFGSEIHKGWESERGRIYLKHGQPTSIERYPATSDRKPWELWQYHHIDGGIEFIFVDKRGYGDFELVHSTAKNEIRDYQWERHLSDISPTR